MILQFVVADRTWHHVRVRDHCMFQMQHASADSPKSDSELKPALVTAALLAAFWASQKCTTRGGKENTMSWCVLRSELHL